MKNNIINIDTIIIKIIQQKKQKVLLRVEKAIVTLISKNNTKGFNRDEFFWFTCSYVKEDNNIIKEILKSIFSMLSNNS